MAMSRIVQIAVDPSGTLFCLTETGDVCRYIRPSKPDIDLRGHKYHDGNTGGWQSLPGCKRFNQTVEPKKEQ